MGLQKAGIAVAVTEVTAPNGRRISVVIGLVLAAIAFARLPVVQLGDWDDGSLVLVRNHSQLVSLYPFDTAKWVCARVSKPGFFCEGGMAIFILNRKLAWLRVLT